MLESSSQNWGGTSVTVAVALLVTFVLGLALVRYVEWSSDANLAHFMSRTEVTVAGSTPILPLQVRTGCGRKLPTSALSLPLE